VKRVLGLLAVLAACAGVVLLVQQSASRGPAVPTYKVELDNAFGLTEGGDFKVAGVRSGKTTKIDLDKRTNRAIVTFEITEAGFGSLRKDTRCSVEPQSLIGEYYVDCDPGVAKEKIPQGATIPVEQTQGTIPPDLVNNIMRRPYRERFSYVIAELGAAVAGNAENLQGALKRANPALRETNKVLALLARQNQTLADLTRDADRVVGELADKRTDVTRFVTEARDTARASAERDDDIAAGFRRLPTFLRELRPTMAELGRTVDAQGPALRNVALSAGQLERLFRNLPPFARASQQGLDALGEASKVGRGAIRSARPTVQELNTYSRGVPELGKNLAIILEHLDDREFSAELDPRSPGGQGYTGLEALLQYVYDQTLSTNVHDGNVHFLKASPFEGECAQYADIKRALEVRDRCSTELGPNIIGLTFPDRTVPSGGYDRQDRGGPEEGGGDDDDQNDENGDESPLPVPIELLRNGTGERREAARDERRERDPGPAPKAPAGAQAPAPAPAPAAPPAPAPEVPPAPAAAAAPPSAEDAKQAQEALLDYLLGS
jgi:virulence factor Mce-like protein